MKTTAINQILILATICMVLAGCKDNVPEVSADSLFVTAVVISNGNPPDATSISVGLNNMSSEVSDRSVTGASVRVNGHVVEENSPGAYTLLLTDDPIQGGVNVTLNIAWGGGTLSVSAVMPERGKETSVDVPGAYHGSFLKLGNNI